MIWAGWSANKPVVVRLLLDSLIIGHWWNSSSLKHNEAPFESWPRSKGKCYARTHEHIGTHLAEYIELLKASVAKAVSTAIAMGMHPLSYCRWDNLFQTVIIKYTVLWLRKRQIQLSDTRQCIDKYANTWKYSFLKESIPQTVRKNSIHGHGDACKEGVEWCTTVFTTRIIQKQFLKISFSHKKCKA